MPKVTIVCPVCGKSFAVYQTEVNRGRRYCGHSCAMVEANAKRPPRPKGTTLLDVTCEQCGTVFRALPYYVRNGQRFCSKRCRALWQNGERHNRYKGGPQTITCDNCGKAFDRPPSQTLDRAYCSRACQYTHMRGPESASWKGGRHQSGDYIYVYMPDHPNAHATGYVGEHVLVASQNIGRPLLPGEHAHHDNEITTDNRPSNIVVLTASEHKKLHHARKREKEGLKV